MALALKAEFPGERPAPETLASRTRSGQPEGWTNRSLSQRVVLVFPPFQTPVQLKMHLVWSHR